MYFINEEHESNFKALQIRFPQVANDAEYKSACYICSVQGIFYRFNMKELEHGPFDWLFEDLRISKENDKDTERLFRLKDSRGDYYLALLGLHFWNGDKNDFQLNKALYNWNIEYLKVFEQVCII
jgi:hypothetical protein